MKGIHSVYISDNRVKYRFELTRNITVVQGNSGTGKTTLFEMISAFTRQKEKSSVQINCDKPCVALRPDSDWSIMLRNIKDSIVFIDEEAEYVSKPDFASAIKRTDNYYVIFTRENLYYLPYSVEEIYEVHTSGKIHTFRKMYRKQNGCRYSMTRKEKKKTEFSVFLVEDSKSGFQFYKHFFDGTMVKCLSAGANSSIYNRLVENIDKNIFVVADGAAFGAEMNKVMNLQERFPNITICLPESFEWMILKSGLIKAENLDVILTQPSEYIESSQYFSWERFFTDYLVQNTADEHYSYNKKHLNSFYVVKSNMDRIVALIGLG